MSHAEHESGVVGDRAVISGIGSALLFHKLLPPDPRRALIHSGLTGDQLRLALQAVEALRESASRWQEETISDRGNAEGRGKPKDAHSELSWLTTSETARLLDLSTRRVRQMGDEGVLTREMVGGSWQFASASVLALKKARTEI